MSTVTSHGGGHGYGETVPPEYGGVGHVSHPSLRVYLITYALLVVLLFITVIMYYVNLNAMLHAEWPNIVVAMIVAITKATLVVLYFMNVKGSTRLTWLWAGLGFVWLLLMAGIFMDYQTRVWVAPTGWQ